MASRYYLVVTLKVICLRVPPTRPPTMPLVVCRRRNWTCFWRNRTLWEERTRSVLFSIRDPAGNEFTGSITAVLDDAPDVGAQVLRAELSNVLSAVPAARTVPLRY